MPHHPNLTVQLTNQELKTIRELAEQLSLTIVGGTRSGEGSPRRLLQELARAAQSKGVQATAKALEYILQE